MISAERVSAWAAAMNQMGRPFLTVVVTMFYNAGLVLALAMGKLDINTYIAAVGPVNGMVVGYWFKARDAEAEIARMQESRAKKESSS